jgi:hypothetical protein
MREEAHQRGIDWRDYGPWLDLQAVINAPYTPRATPRDTKATSRSSSRAALRLSTRPRKRVVKAAGKASVRVRVRDTAAVTAEAVRVTVGHPAETTYAGASRKAKRSGSRVRITLGKIAAGRAKTVTARFKVKPIARGKLGFKVAVRAANAKTEHASAKITVQ